MSFRDYAPKALLDWLLCTVLAVTAVIVIGSGYKFDALRLNIPLVVGMCAVLQAILVAGTFGKKQAVASGIGFVVAALVICFVAASSSSDSRIFEDEQGNCFIFALFVLAACLAVFALSRRKVLAVILAVAGTFSMAACQFLYSPNLLWAYGLFMVASLVNCVFRYYASTLRKSQSVKVAYGSVCSITVVVCVAALLLASGVWFAVIAPMNPPAQELVLIIDQRAQPEIEVKGTSEVRQMLEDIASNQKPDQEATTGKAEDDGQEESDGIGDGNLENPDEGSQGSAGADGDAAFGGGSVYEFWVSWWFVLVIAVVLLVFALIVGKRAWQKRRLARIRRLSPRGQVLAYAAYLTWLLKRIGISKASADTPREFVAHANAQLLAFEGCEYTDADGELPHPQFEGVVHTVEAVVYANAEPTEKQIAAMEAYCQQFHPRAKAYLGTRRYLLRWIRL